MGSVDISTQVGAIYLFLTLMR